MVVFWKLITNFCWLCLIVSFSCSFTGVYEITVDTTGLDEKRQMMRNDDNGCNDKKRTETNDEGRVGCSLHGYSHLSMSDYYYQMEGGRVG